MDTIVDLDQRLDMERLAFAAAVEAGDLACAEEHYKRLDLLLERRTHCPLPRQP